MLDRERRVGLALAGALAALALLRAWWAWHLMSVDPGALLYPDSPSYLAPARTLLEQGRFLREPGGEPMLARTPGYPLLLAALLAIWDDERWVSAAQAFLSVIPVGIVYVLARRALGDRRLAILAAAIVAIDPMQLVAAGNVLTEAWATTAMALVALAGWRVFARPAAAVGWLDLGLLGLATTWATLIRPTTYYLPLFLVALVIWHFRASPRARVGILVGALVLPTLVVIGGWSMRNHDEFGSWRYSSIDAVNLYCYRAVEAVASANDASIESVQFLLGCGDFFGDHNWQANCVPWAACPITGTQSEGEFYNDMQGEGISLLLSHPVETAILTVRSAGTLLFGPGTSTVQDYLGLRSAGLAVSAPLVAWTLAVSAFAAVGAVSVARRQHPERAWWVFCIVLTVYVVALSSGPESYSRMRTPIVPLLALFAAAGVRTVRAALSRRAATTNDHEPDPGRPDAGRDPHRPGPSGTDLADEPTDTDRALA